MYIILYVCCDQDIATRVIGEGLRPEQTIVSKIMTRNPIFLTSDSLAIEALQKMVNGELHVSVIVFLLYLFLASWYFLNFWQVHDRAFYYIA